MTAVALALSSKVPADLAHAIIEQLACTRIQSRIKGYLTRSTRPPLDRHVFHLIYSDEYEHIYSYGGSEFIESLELWCAQKRGLYSIEVKLEFASGSVSYVPDGVFSASPLRWYTPLMSDLQMLLHAYTKHLGQPKCTIWIARRSAQHSRSPHLMW